VPTLSLLLLLAGFFLSAQETCFSRNLKRGSIPAEALQLLTLANQARAAAGVAPLQWDPALAAAARWHCLSMSLQGQLAHSYKGEPSLTERARQSGARFSLVQENIGVNSSLVKIQEEWVRSEESRANMLNPDLDHIGVALLVVREGSVYAVADFSRARKVLSPTQVEATVAALLQRKGLFIVQDTIDARNVCRGSSMINRSPNYVMVWQNADLTQLPEEVLKLLANANIRKAAVGNCEPLDLDGQFNSYRVAVLFYNDGFGPS
jgi:uncharacterized protein YkwD